MSYLVFARKYRPQRFDDVVGQEHVTRTIRNALKRDRISSGYLFCGPRGTGKTTVARLLAKAVNCVNGPTDTPCGECPACIEITAGSSLDVLEIDAASNTGVDDIRALRENVRYLPTGGKKRVYIIDEVHRLSGSAFDALLKTLEEPPPHVIFVMATTDPLKVPETILSRTQRFDFRRVGHDDLAANMRHICETEGITVEPMALNLLARKADGSVRDSLSLLDQIAAFAGDTITPQDVVNALGLVDHRFLVDFVEAVAASDRQRVLLQIKQLFDSGIEIKDFVLELMDHLRNLMILRSAPEAAGLTELGNDELVEAKKQAEYFTLGDVLRLMKIVSDVHADLRSGLDERLLLETAAVKMAHLESTVRFEEVLARLESGQAPAMAPGSRTGDGDADFFGGSGRAMAAVSTPAAPSVAAPRSPEPVVGFLNMPQLQAGWSSFAAVLKKTSPMVASQLNMARLQTVHENRIKMLFPASASASKQLVTKAENLALIHKTLRDQYRVNLTIEFTVETQPEAGGAAGEAEQKKVDPAELLKSSERLRSIMNRVDGEIIGIRQLHK